MRLAALLILSCLTAPAAAPEGSRIVGRVVGVHDGDTLTILPAERIPLRVRLLGLDAPEQGQTFGKAARRRLSDRVHGREVELRVCDRDRYGRLVGTVWMAGRDIGLEQVREGLAWHYLDYADRQFAGEAQAYAQAEREARSARRGLWAFPEPVPPWRWRRAVRGR